MPQRGPRQYRRSDAIQRSIDQAVTELVARYTKTINNSRNLFLGVLGHDLRNPLGAVSMGAQWIKRSGTTSPKQAKVVSEIKTAPDRATRILNDLLDLTRSSFGTEIPVVRTETDIASLCQEIADELRAINPDRRIEIAHEGDPMGACDRARLGQALSNLIGNAVQYGDASSHITVSVAGNDSETVTVAVHNMGTSIPMETQKLIFQSWMRGQDVKQPPEQGTHLGLGPFIAKLIAEAQAAIFLSSRTNKQGRPSPFGFLAVEALRCVKSAQPCAAYA